jgi:Family of unknown function (DUF6059)
MWRGLRYLVPRWGNCLLAVTMMGGYWIPLDPVLASQQAPDPLQADSAMPVGPPPGHPERLVGHQPLSAAERELAAALEEIRL